MLGNNEINSWKEPSVRESSRWDSHNAKLSAGVSTRIKAKCLDSRPPVTDGWADIMRCCCGVCDGRRGIFTELG